MNRRGKWTYALLAAMLTSMASPLTAWADSNAVQVKLEVDHSALTTAVPPQIIGGSTMLPLRAMSESQGAEVAWDAKTKTVYVMLDGTVVQLPLGSKTAFVNGKEIALATPAQIVNGSTLVPLRFVSEALGSKVSWNPDEKKASVVSAANLVKLDEVSGGVEVFDNGTWRAGKDQELLEKGVKIRTAGSGQATLLASDGSALRMEANTETEVLELDRNNNSGVRQASFEVLRGKITALAVKQEEGSKFAVWTQGTEVIAPEGAFRLSADEEKGEVSVLAGRVMLQEADSNELVNVPANTYIAAVRDKFAPSAPVFIPNDKAAEWNKLEGWLEDNMIRIKQQFVESQKSLIAFAEMMPIGQEEAHEALIHELKQLQEADISQQNHIREIMPRLEIAIPQSVHQEALSTQAGLFQLLQDGAGFELTSQQKKEFAVKQVVLIDKLLENEQFAGNESTEIFQQAQKLQGTVVQKHDIQNKDLATLAPQFDQSLTWQPIELPSNAELPRGIVLPPGLHITPNTKLPENVQLPPGVAIPENFMLPEGAVLPHDAKLPDNFQLPPNAKLQPGFEWNQPGKLPEGVQLPIGFEIKNGMELPKHVKLPPGVQIPEGMKLPEGIVLPPEVLLPPGIEIPNGAVIPDGMILPRDVKFGENVHFGDFVQFENNAQPDASHIPPDMVWKEGVLVPKDFKGKLERDSDGNVLIIEEDGTVKNVQDMGLPPLPPPPSGQPGQNPPQGGQQPGQNPPQGGQQPGQIPPQGGQQPGQIPPQGGKQPGQIPPQGGQQPGQNPPQGGQQPGQNPPQGGQQPGQYTPSLPPTVIR